MKTKKTTAPRPSRLVPQRPERQKKIIPRRRRPQNSYRRNRFKGDARKTWLRWLAGVFGVLTLAGLCVGLVVLYHQLLTCSTFCIKDINQIEIVGAKRLSRQVLLQQTKLAAGINLVAVRPAQVERALMAHPWVAGAQVFRKWPNRLLIKIQERDPVALVQINEGLLYMDRQGMIFKPLSPGDPHNFPVITGLSREQFHHDPGDLPEVVAQIFHLMDVLKKNPPPLSLENISEIHVDLVRGFTLYANGLKVAMDLGFKDYSKKLQKFAQLWPVLVNKGLLPRVGRINLNLPRRVLVTLKGVEANP
jgi:cell division protein FtsQ